MVTSVTQVSTQLSSTHLSANVSSVLAIRPESVNFDDVRDCQHIDAMLCVFSLDCDRVCALMESRCTSSLKRCHVAFRCMWIVWQKWTKSSLSFLF